MGHDQRQANNPPEPDHSSMSWSDGRRHEKGRPYLINILVIPPEVLHMDYTEEISKTDQGFVT